MNDSSEFNSWSADANSSFVLKSLELNTFQSVSHVFLCVTGLPLNLLIIVVILTNKRLNQKPRNVLWLGVIVSNFFTLLTILIEFLAYYYDSVLGCQVFAMVTGVAYTCLLYNLLLALLDRYAAIVYPFVHREKVTVRKVVAAQLLGALFFFLLIKCPFLLCWVPLQCTVVPVHGKIIAVSNMILLVSCIVAQFTVYLKTRNYFQADRVVSVSFIPGTARVIGPESLVTPTPSTSVAAERGKTTTSNRSSESLTVHGTHREMEVEATFSLLAGVMSLVIFTLPTLINGFVEWGCRIMLSEDGKYCTHILSAMPYCRELLLYHLVYNPVLYMLRSREFLCTIKEKWFHKSSSNGIINMQTRPALAIPTCRQGT